MVIWDFKATGELYIKLEKDIPKNDVKLIDRS